MVDFCCFYFAIACYSPLDTNTLAGHHESLGPFPLTRWSQVPKTDLFHAHTPNRDGRQHQGEQLAENPTLEGRELPEDGTSREPKLKVPSVCFIILSDITCKTPIPNTLLRILR